MTASEKLKLRRKTWKENSKLQITYINHKSRSFSERKTRPGRFGNYIWSDLNIDTHVFYKQLPEVNVEWPYTCFCESTPHSHLVYSGSVTFSPAGGSGQVNQWLVMRTVMQSLARRSTLSPGIKGEGGDTREQSRGWVIRDLCVLTLKKHTFWLYWNAVYKPLLGSLVYCTYLGPIKILQWLTLFTLFRRYLSHT